MRIEQTTITPSDAERMLNASQHAKQRPMNTARVRRLAAIITAGQWRLTHQGVAFTEDATLVDGQHRLAAIAMAGMAVPMMVAYDVPADTFDVIDTGAVRSPGAILSMAGYTDTNVLAAAARYYLAYRTVAGTSHIVSGEIRSTFAGHDILAVMEGAAGERILGAMKPANRIASAMGRPGLRTWIAAAVAILDDVDPAPAARDLFLEGLENGTMLEVHSPVLRLRRWLTSDTGYQIIRHDHRGYIGIALTVKAWNAVLNGDQWDAAQTRFRPGMMTWPVPLNASDVLIQLDATA